MLRAQRPWCHRIWSIITHENVKCQKWSYRFSFSTVRIFTILELCRLRDLWRVQFMFFTFNRCSGDVRVSLVVWIRVSWLSYRVVTLSSWAKSSKYSEFYINCWKVFKFSVKSWKSLFDFLRGYNLCFLFSFALTSVFLRMSYLSYEVNLSA